MTVKVDFNRWIAFEVKPEHTTKISKNIVLCSDGTGNMDIKNRGSNVFKLYEAVDIHGNKRVPYNRRPQIAFYDDGLGTKFGRRICGQAFGLGFGENVRRLYTMLAHVYFPGDRIYLFGFSRGAYTARTLSGMIQHCGVIDGRGFSNNEDLEKSVEALWKEYRAQVWPRRWWKHEDVLKDIEKIDVLPKEPIPFMLYRNVPIEFIGVWDTVGAIGIPFRKVTKKCPLFRKWFYWFENQKPGDEVKKARQALSIDDERTSFHPELWDENGAEKGKIKQVWFAGSHSNVGGGYPKQGMSLVALDWMMAEAEVSGLRFIREDRKYVKTHQDVHDKLYDPREGLGTMYRWSPRNIECLCSKSNCETPKIHISVFERMDFGTGGYAPGNIPHTFEVVATRTDPFGLSKIKPLNNIFNRSNHFSSCCKCVWIFFGKLTYWVFMLSTIMLVLILIWGDRLILKGFYFLCFAVNVSVVNEPRMIILKICTVVLFVLFLWILYKIANYVDKHLAVIANRRWQPLRNKVFKAFL